MISHYVDHTNNVMIDQFKLSEGIPYFTKDEKVVLLIRFASSHSFTFSFAFN